MGRLRGTLNRHLCNGERRDDAGIGRKEGEYSGDSRIMR